MSSIRKIFLLGLFIGIATQITGQDSTNVPISYRIFNTVYLNPAINGIKDYQSVDFIAAFQEHSNSQIISWNSRLTTNKSEYMLSSGQPNFTRFGVGASVFNESGELYHNAGVLTTFSYHIPVSTDYLSFFSLGASFKGIYNATDTITVSDPGNSALKVKTFIPSLDFGVYYYSPNIFAGLSVNNVVPLGETSNETLLFGLPTLRQYNFIGGYKFRISRIYEIIIEPSIIVSAFDSTLSESYKSINPMLKLYYGSFSVGSYLYKKDRISFFFQHRFRRIYVGALFSMPTKSPYFKMGSSAEFTLGYNFSSIKSKRSTVSHW